MAQIEEEMSLPEYASDVAKLTELSKKKEQCEKTMEEAMEKWEQAAQALEENSLSNC